MVISPSDVQPERDAITRLASSWNAQIGKVLGLRVEMVAWETHAAPALGGSPQGLLNGQIVDECDLAIAVFWTRLGTPTASHPSGSVEEIARLAERGAPVMVYFKSASVPQSSLGDDQFARLQKVKADLRSRGLVWDFANPEDLVGLLQLHLAAALSRLGVGRDAGQLGQVSALAASPADLEEARRRAVLAKLRGLWTGQSQHVHFNKEPVLVYREQAFRFTTAGGAHGRLVDPGDELLKFDMAGTADHLRRLPPVLGLRFPLPGPGGENLYISDGHRLVVPTRHLLDCWRDEGPRQHLIVEIVQRPVWTGYQWVLCAE
ncbi:MAG: hypothetical protein Q8P41_22550 [Pseudomonadota bacterium]|nr:hypothetical protein [Pseudomonadota bacterium]